MTHQHGEKSQISPKLKNAGGSEAYQNKIQSYPTEMLSYDTERDMA